MIILNPQTKRELEKIVKDTSHALLFSGPEGSGKGYAAFHFASMKLGMAYDELKSYPYLRVFAPKDNSLGIESIRELQKFLRLKTLGSQQIRRIAIIEDAHLMTNEAQNALLKSLEEPPADTLIILTAPATRQIKDTIYSRVQRLEILPINKKQALEHFDRQFQTKDIEKFYLMSGGLPGLLQALLHNEDHSLARAVQTAKDIITSPTFDRLSKVDELAKQKDQLPVFLQACKLIAGAALHGSIQKHDQPAAKRWHQTLETIHKAESTLAYNPNPKLLLTGLFLQM